MILQTAGPFFFAPPPDSLSPRVASYCQKMLTGIHRKAGAPLKKHLTRHSLSVLWWF